MALAITYICMYIISMPRVKEVYARSILTPQKVGSLASAYDFSLNPYAGCAFACSYCYVPKFPSARHQPEEWGSWVEAKLNAPQLIIKERALVFGSRIFFSSATDPYQYIELKYRLSRACLRELLKYKPKKLTLHTRSHLILQDLDLLKQFGESLSVGISISSDCEEIVRDFEPQAPSLERRLQLLKTLSAEGISVFASLAPLLPHDGERLVQLIKPYVSRVWLDQLRWPEVSTAPQLLKRHESYFQAENYQRTLLQLKRYLTDCELQVKP